MTNYYRKEDDPVETPDVTMDNIEAVERGLTTITEQVADQVNRSAKVTEWLYPRQKTEEDMSLIAEQHQTIDALAVRITQLDIAFRMSAAFSKKIDQTYRRLAGEYTDLEDAAVCNDDTHALLRPFAEHVREQTQNDMRQEAYEEAVKAAKEMAYYEMVTELGERLRELSNCTDYTRIQALSMLLLGNAKTDRRQHRLLNLLLETMPEPTASQSELIAALEASIPEPTGRQRELLYALLATVIEPQEAVES